MEDELAAGYEHVGASESNEFMMEMVTAAQKELAGGNGAGLSDFFVRIDRRHPVQVGEGGTISQTLELDSAVKKAKEEVQRLAPYLVETLNFGHEDLLTMALDRVKKRPYLDDEIDERIQRFSRVKQDPSYDSSVLTMAAKAEDIVRRAKNCAEGANASIFSACEVLDKIQQVFVEACQGSKAIFEERQEAKKELREYEACQSDRQDLLRKMNMEAAAGMQDKSIQHLARAVAHAEDFAKEVDDRVHMEEGQNCQEAHRECKVNVEDLVSGEKQELGGYRDRCEADINILDEKIAEHQVTVEHVRGLHREAVSGINQRKVENRRQEQELLEQLRLLQKERLELEQEEEQILKLDDEVTEVLDGANAQLEFRKKQITDLQERVGASLTVMELMEECTTEVMAVVDEVRTRNQKSLDCLRLTSLSELRQSLLTSAVAYKIMITDCSSNVTFLDRKSKEQLAEINTAVRSGLTRFVIKLKEEMVRLNAELIFYKKERVRFNEKLAELTDKLATVDRKLKKVQPYVVLESVDEAALKQQELLQEKWENEPVVMDSMASFGGSGRT